MVFEPFPSEIGYVCALVHSGLELDMVFEKATFLLFFIA